MYNYDTVTEAIKDLKARGFTMDLNLQENCIVCNEEKFNPDDFEIDKVFRFEGESNPDDEAVLYAISSTKHDVKGLLVNGYGISADAASNAIIAKLQRHHQ